MKASTDWAFVYSCGAVPVSLGWVDLFECSLRGGIISKPLFLFAHCSFTFAKHINLTLPEPTRESYGFGNSSQAAPLAQKSAPTVCPAVSPLGTVQT